MQDELAAEIESIQDTLKAEMTARGVDEMTVDTFKVRWQAVTSKRFDTTAFKLMHGDIYRAYSREQTLRNKWALHVQRPLNGKQVKLYRL
jgi:predicted phage-related endonuclease